jgi:hypothetical protein
MKTDIRFSSYLAHFFLEWEMFQTKVVEKIKTHVLCSKICFLKIVPFEIMWKNTVEWGRPQMTIRRKRVTCWITKATDTHIEYVILIAFPRWQWLHERASMLRLYVHFLSCLILITSKVVTICTMTVLIRATEFWQGEAEVLVRILPKCRMIQHEPRT